MRQGCDGQLPLVRAAIAAGKEVGEIPREFFAAGSPWRSSHVLVADALFEDALEVRRAGDHAPERPASGAGLADSTLDA